MNTETPSETFKLDTIRETWKLETPKRTDFKSWITWNTKREAWKLQWEHLKELDFKSWISWDTKKEIWITWNVIRKNDLKSEIT